MKPSKICTYREEELLAERTGNTNGSGSDPGLAGYTNGLSTDKLHANNSRKQLTAKEQADAAVKEAALIAADKVYELYSKCTVMHARCMHGYTLYIRKL